MRGMYRVPGGFVAAGLICGILVGGAAVRAQDPAAVPPITVQVDASETTRRILHTHLTIPVQPGALTLYFRANTRPPAPSTAWSTCI